MQLNTRTRRLLMLPAAIVAVLFVFASGTMAHPLGNFTINHFTRIEVGRDRVHLRYVIDMAEISTLQELQAAGVADVNAPSKEELDFYLSRMAAEYPVGLALTVDGSPIELRCTSKKLSMPDGAGGLKTLRTELDYEGDLTAPMGVQAHTLNFEDRNHDKRIGWREMIAVGDSGVSLFNSSIYGSPVTDELKAYPQDAVAAPLNERIAALSFTSGLIPDGAKPLEARAGGKLVSNRDALAELISAQHITPLAALLGLLIAVALGSVHAMSPGHGKTVVGAYLVGSRGTAKHAVFLGLTVTITHTAGVFALGVITLVASKYVLPEKLFPILSFLSGAMVAGIGLSLLVRRLRVVLAGRGVIHTGIDGNRHTHAESDSDHHQHHSQDHSHDNGLEHHPIAHAHSHDDVHFHSHEAGSGELSGHIHHHPTGHDHDHVHHHGHTQSHDHVHPHDHERRQDHGNTHDHIHDHTHDHIHNDGHEHQHSHDLADGHVHSHGGVAHSHLPPGADGQPIGWRSLLALGISGGLLPCPSALVVLLAAISLHRVGYGLLLVVAFSAGLAGSLTAVGLLFVYAGKLMKAKSAGRMATLGRIVPVFSSLVITLAGSAICLEALGQAGIRIGPAISSTVSAGFAQNSAMTGFGWVAVVGALVIGGFYWLRQYNRRRHGW
ncbi:MAG TPA: hypothetical protein VLZ81_10090 [Blastocatellia bacterium]|nr:hypothetical protein [Blastocatellia bacterium]